MIPIKDHCFFDLIQIVASLIEKNPIVSQECKFKQSKEKFNLLFKKLILNAEKICQSNPNK